MAVFDLPTLLARRILAIYKNGLKLIVPDTASTPAGKIAHGEGFATDVVDSSINRVTDNHRLNQRRWTANTPTYGANTKTYDDLETCELYDIIWQNRSGGTLTFASVPTLGLTTPWFPLTNGGAPTFNIPFWNNTGVVMQVGGAAVSTGAVAYANQVIVRAENGLYQRNDITNPPPVSTNFLDEYNDIPSKWLFLGEFIFLTRAEFAVRLGASTLIANRSYFLTDVNVFLQATNTNNYSRDGYLLVAYGAAPQRGTTEIERVKYDAVANVFLERIDNWGNHAIQTSDSVNGGLAANCITFAPWGHNEFENNILDNVRYSAANVANGSISSYKNNNLKNTLVTNPSPGTTIVFDSNTGFGGTFITASNTTTFEGNQALNGGTVVPGTIGVPSGNLSDSSADGTSCVNSSPNSRVTGINSSIATGASRGFCHGAGASIGANAVDAFVISTGGGATGIAGVVIGPGCSTAGRSGLSYNYDNQANGESSSAGGRGSRSTFGNCHSLGWASPIDMKNPASSVAFGQPQSMKIPVGLFTEGAVTGTLVTILNPLTGSPIITMPTEHTWGFRLTLTAAFAAQFARWVVDGQVANSAGGVITAVQDILYMINAGTWTNVSTVRSTTGGGFTPAITINLPGAASLFKIDVTGVAAMNINWFGTLRIDQIGQKT